jgi:U3 small nucleolar ribonucleoprotein protein LCP5
MSDEDEDEGRADVAGDEETRGGVYRPPKLAPMPYTEPPRGKDKKRTGPTPITLSSLARLDPSQPHLESTSGLGATPALQSTRAAELSRMTEFEEENFTRLVMKKRDARRRAADEAHIALGGIGPTGRNGRGGGLEDEFGDVLRAVGRPRSGVVGDGYEELRQKGKKDNVLVRSRTRPREDVLGAAEEGPRQRKRSRFEKEVKASKKRARR